VLLAARALPAQEARDSGRVSPRLTIVLGRDSTGALLPPRVTAEHLIHGGSFDGALRNGFPVRFGFRLALWRDAALFDHLVGETEWDAVVILDPVAETYELIRTGGADESFATVRALDEALATPFAVDLLPPPDHAGDRYYYVVTLTMESLSVSDLEEVERWLRGDLGRALTRRGDVGNALSRGARLLMIRLSGLPRRVLVQRTERFHP